MNLKYNIINITYDLCKIGSCEPKCSFFKLFAKFLLLLYASCTILMKLIN